ncbi:sensor histidine kinase [Sutcliffiella horikoshii]|uniref:sensor histidine kinase n=1 Tax=Sutcliffiella horikoshii TaxID=79883 RepID=UPI001F254FE7|nr:HAMP domain-containing sensor histidine kinase [Sutcliffiella horikoshii]MCG1023239.1 HAMP domain-containing histidine kinase [Sutcliffiella horikoshii]
MKFSTKLGLWFFICLLIIESISMLVLHRHVVDSLVKEELNSLLARGNSHRDVLLTSITPDTIQHIVLMESNTDTEVVIINENGSVIDSSMQTSNLPHYIVKKSAETDDGVVQADWKQEAFIATVSPFRSEEGSTGYVYMLKSTNSLQKVIQQLNHHFGIAVVIIMLFLLVTNIFLIKMLTKPLIRMKDATQKISHGDFTVKLPIKTKDELGELAESIQALANHLNHLQQERKEFLASISHELRTPLTYIKGYAELGRKPTLEDTVRLEYLHIIHEESTRVSNMLEDLFELAKMDQNAFSIQTQRRNMEEFILPIYERARPAFDNAGIDLKLDVIKSFDIQIDPRRFEQIVLNLLDNALKYSSAGSTTTIQLNKRGDECFLTIHDQGKGIPEEDIPYILDRFYRVEKSRSRLTGGVGLGLAIVNELVEAHGGTLSIKSEQYHGTEVTILLRENENDTNSND